MSYLVRVHAEESMGYTETHWQQQEDISRQLCPHLVVQHKHAVGDAVGQATGLNGHCCPEEVLGLVLDEVGVADLRVVAVLDPYGSSDKVGRVVDCMVPQDLPSDQSFITGNQKLEAILG